MLGISVDHVPALKAWADTFQGIQYPLLSDFWPHGEVCQLYSVLRSVGSSERAIFIVDKQGLIQYIDIHDVDDLFDFFKLRVDAGGLHGGLSIRQQQLALRTTGSENLDILHKISF